MAEEHWIRDLIKDIGAILYSFCGIAIGVCIIYWTRRGVLNEETWRKEEKDAKARIRSEEDKKLLESHHCDCCTDKKSRYFR